MFGSHQVSRKGTVVRWFKPVWILFMPVSIAGWLLSLAALAFCLQTFIAVDRHSHSASDTLCGVFPYWVPALLVLTWIADRTGARSNVN